MQQVTIRYKDQNNVVGKVTLITQSDLAQLTVELDQEFIDSWNRATDPDKWDELSISNRCDSLFVGAYKMSEITGDAPILSLSRMIDRRQNLIVRLLEEHSTVMITNSGGIMPFLEHRHEIIKDVEQPKPTTSFKQRGEQIMQRLFENNRAKPAVPINQYVHKSDKYFVYDRSRGVFEVEPTYHNQMLAALYLTSEDFVEPEQDSPLSLADLADIFIDKPGIALYSSAGRHVYCGVPQKWTQTELDVFGVIKTL